MTKYQSLLKNIAASTDASKNLILMKVKKDYPFLTDREQHESAVLACQTASKKFNFWYEFVVSDPSNLGWSLCPIVTNIFGQDKRFKCPTLNTACSLALAKAADDLFYDEIRLSRDLFDKSVIEILKGRVDFDKKNNATWPGVIEKSIKKLEYAKQFFKDQEDDYTAACEAACESSIY